MVLLGGEPISVQGLISWGDLVRSVITSAREFLIGMRMYGTKMGFETRSLPSKQSFDHAL